MSPASALPGSDGGVLGIDGCRGGWVWCGFDAAGWAGGVVPRLTDLTARIDRAAIALIDMPIGLSAGGRDERGCDRAARALLGRPRSSSVFRTPCRAVLASRDYRDACAISRTHTGVALSLQTWHLLAKIREVDALLCAPGGPRDRLREAHPELCLAGLAGGRAMTHNKRTAAGRAERLALLRSLCPDAAALGMDLAGRHPRRLLAADDAIDAAVLAVSARGLRAFGASRLPDQPETDGRGLPMEMLYWRREVPARATDPRPGRAVATPGAIF